MEKYWTSTKNYFSFLIWKALSQWGGGMAIDSGVHYEGKELFGPVRSGDFYNHLPFSGSTQN